MAQNWAQLQPIKNLLSQQKVLVAVSSGVDSMVLLTVLENLAASWHMQLGVAHLNHHLRTESFAEAAFMATYCQQKALPYFQKDWQTPATTNVENAARAFRYQFFAETMTTHGYTVLVTAHHADDQAETMLMRLARGGSVESHAGIRESQPFATGKLVRPLLHISKQQVREYAKQYAVPHFEDATNETDDYFRNRIRHHVVPVLKAENPKALAQMNQFSQALFDQTALVAELLQPDLAQLIQKKPTSWQLPFSVLHTASPLKRQELLIQISRTLQQVDSSFYLNQKQVVQVEQLLQTGASQWQVDLAAGWQVKRRYDEVVFEQVASANAPQLATVELPGEGALWLNDQQWVGLVKANQLGTLPPLPAQMAEIRLELQLAATDFPLHLRKRLPGDRLALTAQLTKKVARYFVDCKIPLEKRAASWILATKQKEIIGLLPFVVSYLRKGEQPDKIHYMLLFRYTK
jgi:tRNA(Ile)-lysidine synthase